MTLHALNPQLAEPTYDSIWTLTPQGFKNMAFLEWGDKRSENALICIHGFSRNSHDFDFLARELQSYFNILCPDLLGCGESHYLKTPNSYSFSQYMNDISSLFARINASSIHILGTSLGGIIGMMLAAQPNSPIKSLTLNDVGMIIPSTAFNRQALYAQNDNKFDSLHEAKRYFQTILSTSGIHDHKHWDHITQFGIWRDDEGSFRLAHDPAIGQSFKQSSGASLHLEAYWKEITCPIHIIKGEDSDFLTNDILNRMLSIQKTAWVSTVKDCGHAPSLMPPEQIKLVKEWLDWQTS